MSVKIGISELRKVKTGENNIAKIMIGTEKIWPLSANIVLTFHYYSENAYLLFEEIEKEEAIGTTYYENYQFDSANGVLEIFASNEGV